MTVLTTSASRTNLVRELFVRTADENYVTARWCARNGLDVDFLWLALHAVEKYLKAVLLLNGRSAKSYGHDLSKLLEDVRTVAGPLVPDHLRRPAELDGPPWPDRPTGEFVRHLEHNGNADNRYLVHGFVTNSEDVHLLDALVFAIRRLCCTLDGHHFLGRGSDARSLTSREMLERFPSHFARMAMPLDDIVDARSPSELRSAALNFNFAFAPAGFEHQVVRSRTSARNAVIDRRILRPLQSSDPERAAEAVEDARWLLDNVHLPKASTTKRIEAAVSVVRARHGWL